MNTRAYPPATRVATDVYVKSGVIAREFGEAEGEDERFYDALTRLLPEFIRLYDHIYAALPEVDPAYPWADGKLDGEKKKKGAVTPLLALPCASKVYNAFVWPIYSALRLLLWQDDRQLMETGRLPRVIPPLAVEPRWPTLPTGHIKLDTSIGVVRCAACDGTGAQVSFHFPDGRVVRFHGRCHRLWEEECERMDGSGPRRK